MIVKIQRSCYVACQEEIYEYKDIQTLVGRVLSCIL